MLVAGAGRAASFPGRQRPCRLDAAITAYARDSLSAAPSAIGVANDLCNRIHDDFAYDGEATTVATPRPATPSS